MEKTITLTKDELDIINLALSTRCIQVHDAMNNGCYPEEFGKSLIKEMRDLKDKLNN